MRVWLKRTAYVVGTVIALVIVAVGCVYALSARRFSRIYDVATETITVSDDSATLARGEHFVNAIAGCADCHGEGLRGQPVIDASPMGRIVALNLTKGEGGVGAKLTPALIERAVRHGIAPEGRPLLIMPSDEYQYMSDDDLRAVVAYVRHVAPVNNTLPPTNLMLLPRTLLLAGQMPLLPAEAIARDGPAKPMNVPAAPNAEYGHYLALVSGCHGCHGPGLSGGKIPGGDPAWGPAANLTPTGNLGKWSEDDFKSTLRTGKRPDGIALKEPMPWKVVGRMTDDELHALWMYLKTAPPKDFGNR
jgi:mono/diheme cytochrome c family protein